MKKLIALAAVATMAWSSFGQGTVDFRNSTSVLGTANDYMVRFAGVTPDNVFGTNGAPVVGTKFVSQLWYGEAAGTLIGPVGATAAFRASTTSVPGTWTGGTRTVPDPYGIGKDTSVWLQIRVWDASLAPTWADIGPAYNGLLGSSAPFEFTFFASSPVPLTTDDDMVGFRGFSIAAVPEPTAFALLGLGMLGLWTLRRKN